MNRRLECLPIIRLVPGGEFRQGCLVFVGSLDAFDHDDVDGRFGGFQIEAELFP